MTTPKKVPKMLPTSVSRGFTQYVIYYISGGGSPAIGLPQEAEIDCFTDKNERAGILYFYPDNVALPQNRDTVNGIYLYYRSSRFGDVMSMLREEKPLYLYLNTTNSSGYVGTGNEPVGEQEGV
jgi:hypothetical protein